MKKPLFINRSCSEYSEDYQYPGIDIAKFSCAYLVCIIHIKPIYVGMDDSRWLTYQNFGLQQYLCRIAVPFYFVSSGYLLFKRIPLDAINADRIKNYCFKILRLLGTWTVLLFVGGKNQLWYLGALVLATLFVNYFVRLAIGLVNDRIGVNLVSFQFIITICLTTILAIFVERLSNCKKLIWVKHLYS